MTTMHLKMHKMAEDYDVQEANYDESNDELLREKTTGMLK